MSVVQKTSEHGISDYIRSLSDVSRSQLSEVGGKAANLGELLKAGFPVPDGHVLTTKAFEQFVQANNLGNNLTPEAIKFASISEEMKKAISSMGKIYGDVLLAVRSSCVAEDLSNASFAGQYETVLGVKGGDEMEDAIKRCWASAFSARIRAYKDAHNMGSKTDTSSCYARMAVLIQRLVRADAAGVAFTANPVTGDRNEVVVNSIRGVGERVVSGLATPDEWVVRQSDVLCKSSPENAISEEQARLIANLAREVEDHFGIPQDIEWAISSGKLFLLQARPITTLESKKQQSLSQQQKKTIRLVPVTVVVPEEGFWQLDLAHFPKPLSPMYRSYKWKFMSESLKRAGEDFGLFIDGLESTVIGGWDYTRVIPMGGKDRAPPPSWLMPILIRAVPQIRNRIKSAVTAVRNDLFTQYTEKWYSEWKPELIKRSKALSAVELSKLSDSEFQSHIDSVLDYVRYACEVHFRYLGVPPNLAVAQLVFTCRDLLGWSGEKTMELLSGLSETSSEPGYKILDLVKLVQERPVLREHLAREDAIRNLDSIDQDFAQKFRKYLDGYCQRAISYDVIDPTIAEIPSVVLKVIVDQAEKGYATKSDRLAERRRQAQTEARAKLKDTPEKLKMFDEALEHARFMYPTLDEQTFYTQNTGDGLTRYALLELGRRLAERGLISETGDVFFLTLDEARNALKQGTVVGNLKDLAEKRKGEREWALAHPGKRFQGKPPLPPPSLKAFPKEARMIMEALLWTLQANAISQAPVTVAKSEKAVERGIPASAGKYSGIARVVHDESEFHKIQKGDVLVCPTTTPCWSVLFPEVSGLVTENGGLLSHPAIIAREYAIPAVLAVPNATRLIADGQMVEVDGNSGIVTIKN